MSFDLMGHDTKLYHLIKGLFEELGRLPTADEVFGFIFGTPEEREKIRNGG